MRLIDTHAHLDHRRFEGDLEEVLSRAKKSDVDLILTVASDLPSAQEAVRIADQYKQVFAAVGVHPHEAQNVASDYLTQIGSLAQNQRVLALGEMGLDYHYEFSPRKVQQQVFEAQLNLAGEIGLPVIIHSREAFSDTYAILRSQLQTPAVMHCFSGDWSMAKQALDLGCYISLSGVVTFPGARELQAAVKHIPLDRLMLETDAPYLAPVPRRGRRNEPAHVAFTAAFVAELLRMETDQLIEVATKNAQKFFKFPQ